MKRLLAVLLVVGCGQKKSEDKSGAPTAGSGSSAPAAPDPACVESTTKLRAWITELDADGVVPSFESSSIKLVKLDGETAKNLGATPVVTISPHEISFQGKLLSALPVTDKGAALTEALAAAKPDEPTFVIDAAVPWSAVVTAATAATRADHKHVTFAFTTDFKGKTAPPPPSAVDKELDDLAKPADPSQPAPKLHDSNDPNWKSIPDKIFKDCSMKELFVKIGATDFPAKGPLIAEGIPAAIAACNCKVEMASVQRLLWSWYNRDRPAATTGLTLEVAKTGGASLTAKPTATWADASKAVVAAAKAGKPVTLK